jgi:hypothetical protein
MHTTIEHVRFVSRKSELVVGTVPGEETTVDVG